VDFTTGFRCDLISLGRFCREKGLLFCVDAIQSLGAVPLDVRQCGIHFLAAAGHKWLLGPMGCGILYVDGEARPLLHPQGVGWKSVVEEEDFFTIRFDLKPDARVFEPGTMNVAGIYALGAALDLLLEVGVDSIWGRIKAITDILLRGLQKRGLRVVSPLEEEVRSGILSFIPGRDPEGLFKRLMKGDVMVSLRNDLIRLSPHFYNNEEDCDRFFGVLDASQD
jgi:cysteine desulfurase/selenocysteine lyase